MKRITIFVFGVVSYLAFLACFLYAVGFIGNFGVPKTIDSGPEVPLSTALLINTGLLGLFAIQHSVMARQGFKRFITRFIPPAAERSTYVLLSTLCLVALFIYWQPMGGVIWDVQSMTGQVILYSLYGLGWVILLIATFLINHFDLFGLRQVWLELRGKPYTSLGFATPWLYKYVRHPLYVGWLMIFWATPLMTAAHLVFALATTGYILIAIQLEEKDLQSFHQEYARYKEEVPMLIPRMKRRRAGQPVQS